MSSNPGLSKRLDQIQDLAALDLPARPGPRPRTTGDTPHTQLDQNAPIELQHRLRDYASALPEVRFGPSDYSVPGAIAFFLDRPPLPSMVPEMSFCEWGHIHPAYDGSLHVSLPTSTADRLIDLGWAEYHHVVKRGLAPPMLVMLYGRRDELELQVTSRVLDAAYLASGGDLRPPPVANVEALAGDRTLHPDVNAESTIVLPSRQPCCRRTK